MTLTRLKEILILSIGKGAERSEAIGREIVDQMFTEEEGTEIPAVEVVAYQASGTIVLLTNAGLSEPKNVVLVDFKSGRTLLQTVEN
jgi:hypothetical protein